MSSTFTALGVPAELTNRLSQLGITEPFPIQELTLVDALAGRDLCGKAPTGSGKTLAFGLPVAMTVGRAQPGRPRALLLVPTRELASQVSEVLAPLLQVTGRKVATFYGGTNIRRDLQGLRGGIDVAVATPGRLEDLIDRRAISLADVDLVVIDEADRMADMGFLPVVKRLLDQTKKDRQTLLFSATLDGDVDVLIRHYQRDPARHIFESPEEARGDVRHVFWPAERTERRKLTAKILRDLGPAIVFTRTKHGADRLAKQLRQDGVETAAIHGNRSQNQREQALARFSSGRVQTLVATDVAARGIHVDNVAAVVHYDQPATEKDYVHRSGRTGRAGSEGLVVSFVGAEETGDVQKMQRMLDMPQGLHDLDLELLTLAELPAPQLVAAAAGSRPAGKGRPNNRGGGGGGNRSRGQNPRSRGGARSRTNGGGGAGGQRANTDQRSSGSQRPGAGQSAGGNQPAGAGQRTGSGQRSDGGGNRSQGTGGGRGRANAGGARTSRQGGQPSGGARSNAGRARRR